MDLQINVAELLRENVGTNRTVEFDAAVLELEDQEPSQVNGKLVLTKIDKGIWAAGRLDVSADHVCSRCLVPFSTQLHTEMADVFLPKVDPLSGERIRYEEGDADADILGIDDHHVLNLSDALRQYRQAAMPLAPLCKDDCKGLCPDCGIDWNFATCACEPNLDPRWNKLRELLG
jgi:uncharacterized protein